MVRSIGRLALAALMALAIGGASQAQALAPTRSGTIIDGVFTTGPASSCTFQADCALWVARGCPADQSAVNPSLHAAIVDVRDRAGTTSAFEIRNGAGQGVIIGGVFVQYWTTGCDRLEPQWRSFYDCEGPPCDSERGGPLGLRERTWTTLSIPASAAWMTISANDNLNIDWTLG